MNRPALIIPLLAALALPAHAGGHPETVAPVTNALVRKECGECHMAFQPGLLPAGSWSRVMDGLADHFGERATLPPDQTAAIRTYLTHNAGRYGDASILRITGQSWFQRKHHSLAQRWTRPDIKTPSNCAACHKGAEAGRFEDDD